MGPHRKKKMALSIGRITEPQLWGGSRSHSALTNNATSIQYRDGHSCNAVPGLAIVIRACRKRINSFIETCRGAPLCPVVHSSQPARRILIKNGPLPLQPSSASKHPQSGRQAGRQTKTGPDRKAPRLQGSSLQSSATGRRCQHKCFCTHLPFHHLPHQHRLSYTHSSSLQPSGAGGTDT